MIRTKQLQDKHIPTTDEKVYLRWWGSGSDDFRLAGPGSYM